MKDGRYLRYGARTGNVLGRDAVVVTFDEEVGTFAHEIVVATVESCVVRISASRTASTAAQFRALPFSRHAGAVNENH